MSQLFLTDKEVKENLFPFSLMRSVVDIRIGILTIREKWERFLGQPIDLVKEENHLPENSAIFSGNIIPSQEFIRSLVPTGKAIAKTPKWELVKIIQYPWHIFLWNDWALRNDFILVTANRKTQPIPSTVQAINPSQIFIEEGAVLSYCTLNASTGPIYIGKNTEIMEGCNIRGPFALCEGSILKMGAKIYGATTIGPYCVVAGEVKNSVIFGYSNKAHEGYLGDSVVGEWCNLGAGTSNSNMKNTGSDVKVWNPQTKDFLVAGPKCGLILGDYSRSAINTSFNTGTIVGVCSHVFCEGLTPRFIPSFTWGTKGLSKYEFAKALSNIANWKKLKNQVLEEEEIQKLKHIFDHS
jgi:UDP-N-acetylglucosamine diphosphorylase / glucose-1-phosphate thymidylyltransferase / UDP-N-acetylgalactosamine diphosphorylase / glucosamine-1-phosphate N-acetyltransferase / galactosamine-1-phosphate N-acetyltransferase